MQSAGWIALFRRIPAQVQDSVSLSLVTGAELVVQGVLRLDRDFAVLRARLAGTNDGGRVVVLPYDQIVHLSFTRKLNESTVQSMFGKHVPEVPSEPAPFEEEDAPLEAEKSEAESEEAPDEAEAEEAAKPLGGSGSMPLRTAQITTPTAPAAGAESGKPAPPSKSLLLARLRARLAEHGKQQP
jgi:hypothetical protein